MQSRPDARLTLSIFSLLAAAVTVVACSSSPTSEADNDPPSSAAKDSGTSSRGTSTSGSSGSSGSSDTSDTDSGSTDTDGGAADCSKTTDADSCEMCCYNIDPTDVDTAAQAYDDCQCAAATCATVCAASFCGADPSATPTADCNTCLDNNDAACEMKFDAACTSAGCKAASACETTNCAKYDSSM